MGKLTGRSNTLRQDLSRGRLGGLSLESSVLSLAVMTRYARMKKIVYMNHYLKTIYSIIRRLLVAYDLASYILITRP